METDRGDMPSGSTRARGKPSGRGETGQPVRGGARSIGPQTRSRPPHESTVRDLIAEPSSKDGQFDDATTDTDKGAQSAPIEGTASNIEQTPTHSNPESSPRDIDSGSSSINPNTPNFSPPNSKLNPSAPAFSPARSVHPTSPPLATTSKLNPTSPEFSPSAGMNGRNSTVPRTQTYNSSPSITYTGRQTTLNPNSGEFIPKLISPRLLTTSAVSTNSSLNASAPAFVPHVPLPTGMQNGAPDDEEDSHQAAVVPPVEKEEDFDEEEHLLLTSKDILAGVEFPVDQTEDMASDPTLKVTADVLIKMTIYPGSFDRGKMTLEHTVKAWLPTKGTLTNLAEMLIHWGIMEPGLRLSVSRICQVLNEMEQLSGVFRHQMVLRLKVWFDKRTSLEKAQLIDLSLFFAEIFSRIRMINTETREEVPVKILGEAIQVLVTELLTEVEERSVISSCHILKLTGPLLAVLTEIKLDNIFSTLERLSTDETLPLSKKCVKIMVHVMELNAYGWRQPVRPLTSTTSVSVGQCMMGATGGGVASSESEIAMGAILQSDGDIYQVPVSNPDDWNEFLDDDNQLIEEDDGHTTESFIMEERGEGEEELDAEMEKEFEFFVQDLEEHLLNVGEFDPEEFQEEQQQQ